MPTVLLLDAAGTLIQTAEPVGEVYVRHFHEHGAALPIEVVEQAFVQAFRRAPLPEYDRHPDGTTAERASWEAIVRNVLRASGPEGMALADSEAFLPCFEALYDHYALPEAWTPYPDTRPFLDAATESHRMAVVSNFDRRLHGVLAGLDLAPYFELILTSAEARSAKPDPLIFHEALRRLETTPAETLHLGDCPRNDLAGARAAGIPAFHVDRPTHGLPQNLDFSSATPK